MIILELYSDQQAENINGGGRYCSRRFFKEFESILETRCSLFEGNLKAKITQINSVIIGKC